MQFFRVLYATKYLNKINKTPKNGRNELQTGRCCVPWTRLTTKKVCVRLYTSADTVTLPTFAAERRAAVQMDRKEAAPAADGPTAANPPHAAAAVD